MNALVHAMRARFPFILNILVSNWFLRINMNARRRAPTASRAARANVAERRGGFALRLEDLIDVELPIIQAPMAGVQGHALAAAVCSAGGLG